MSWWAIWLVKSMHHMFYFVMAMFLVGMFRDGSDDIDYILPDAVDKFTQDLEKYITSMAILAGA